MVTFDIKTDSKGKFECVQLLWEDGNEAKSHSFYGDDVCSEWFSSWLFFTKFLMKNSDGFVCSLGVKKFLQEHKEYVVMFLDEDEDGEPILVDNDNRTTRLLVILPKRMTFDEYTDKYMEHLTNKRIA